MKEQLLERLPTPICIKDDDGNVLYQNEAARLVLGDCNDTKGVESITIPLQVQSEKDRNDDGSAEKTVTALAEYYPKESEEFVDDDKEEKTKSSKIPRVDSSSSLAGVHDNEISYRILFKNMQTAAMLGEVITDKEGNPIDFVILDVNPAFDRLTGLIGSETVGKPITEAVPGMVDDPANWIQEFGKVALEGKKFTFRHQHSTSLDRWFGGVAYCPAQRRFVSLFFDCSEIVQAEEALRESEERHRNLFESTMQGVVYQEASGAIMAANPSAERILGLTVDQMMGRTSVDPRWRSIHEDGTDFPGETHPSMVALQTGKPIVGVVMGVYHPTDKKTHWILIDAVPRFRSGEDKPFQVYTTFTDLTETKEFERKILLEKERAELADRLKSSFLANMSHEIRTPLNGIMGHIDLALANDLDEAFKAENLEGLHVAKESGNLLLSIIQDILDLSKIEAGQMDVKSDEVFSLSGVVEQTVSIGRGMIRQRNKAIQLTQESDAGINDSVGGDAFRLQQILNNLVSNAIKFTDAGGVRVIVSKYSEEEIEFCVADTGKGIPPEHIETIFDSFRQVEIGDTRKHGGTGLGLTISRKLAVLMGGSLTVESQIQGPNRGSRFMLRIPYIPASHTTMNSAPTSQLLVDQQRPAMTDSKAKPPSITKNGVKRKILVAEDERVNRRLIHRMLDVAGYHVLLAEDGQQAIEVFQRHSDIALILMDVQMPNMDGLEATGRIRKLEDGRRTPVPIVALSAGAMKGDHEEGLSAGMTRYLTKPVNLEILTKTLADLIVDPEAEGA